MPYVRSYRDIVENCGRLRAELSAGNSDAKRLIGNGRCFLAIQNAQGDFEFYPSKFIGYKDNTLSVHLRLKDISRDGRNTNRKIIHIIGALVTSINSPVLWRDMENQYSTFCSKLHISRTNYKRKYWIGK
jgi:hypothetical protein